MQIYNMKKRLSRVLIKFFTLFFHHKSNRLTINSLARYDFSEIFAIFARFNIKREIWQIILYLFALMVLS